MDIEWLGKRWSEVNPVSPADVAQLELAFGVKLPSDYIEFHLTCGGASYAEYDRITVPNWGRTCFLSLAATPASSFPNTLSLIEIFEHLKPFLPQGVFPIGKDPGGNFFCYDYREHSEAPSVVLWDHEVYAYEGSEGAIFPISASFTELVSHLED